jgi:hypothetical protein
MTVFYEKNSFVIKNLVLDPDWIRIQQQPGSGISESEFETQQKKAQEPVRYGKKLYLELEDFELGRAV